MYGTVLVPYRSTPVWKNILYILTLSVKLGLSWLMSCQNVGPATVLQLLIISHYVGYVTPKRLVRSDLTAAQSCWDTTSRIIWHGIFFYYEFTFYCNVFLRNHHCIEATFIYQLIFNHNISTKDTVPYRTVLVPVNKMKNISPRNLKLILI